MGFIKKPSSSARLEIPIKILKVFVAHMPHILTFEKLLSAKELFAKYKKEKTATL